MNTHKSTDDWSLYSMLWKHKVGLEMMITDTTLSQHQHKQIFKELTNVKVRILDLNKTLSLDFQGDLDNCAITDGQKFYPNYDKKKEACF